MEINIWRGQELQINCLGGPIIIRSENLTARFSLEITGTSEKEIAIFPRNLNKEKGGLSISRKIGQGVIFETPQGKIEVILSDSSKRTLQLKIIAPRDLISILRPEAKNVKPKRSRKSKAKGTR